MVIITKWELNTIICALHQNIEHNQNNLDDMEVQNASGLCRLIQMQIEADTALVGKLETIVNSDCKRIAVK